MRARVPVVRTFVYTFIEGGPDSKDSLAITPHFLIMNFQPRLSLEYSLVPIVMERTALGTEEMHASYGVPWSVADPTVPRR